MPCRRLPAALILASLPGLSLAEGPPTSSLETGDLIILRSTAEGFVPILAGEKANGTDFKAPARTKFKVTHHQPGTPGTLYLAVKDVPCDFPKPPAPTAAAPGPNAAASAPPGSASAPAPAKASTITKFSQFFSSIQVSDADCKLKPLVAENHGYEVTAGSLEKYGFRRLGFIYGGLVIPYKYFRHDKSLEPGTTIGPFLGYRLGQTGWGISLVATYAVANISVNVKDGTEMKKRDFVALSRGIGVMFDITKSETPFRAGILWGKDRVGSNNVEVYPHDGHTWVAAQLGWEFGR